MEDKKKAVVGIDPGGKGAIALLSGIDHVIIHDFPKSFSKVYDILDEWDREFLIKLVMLEKVGPLLMGGKKAAFGFGKIAGFYEGIIIGMQLPLKLVLPKEWQKVVSDKTGETSKERSFNTAQELFPFVDLGKRKSNDRADALLMAYYGWKLLVGL